MILLIIRIILTLIIGLLSAQISVAEAAPPEGAVFNSADDGEMIFITELGAVISTDSDKLTVRHIRSADKRPEKYRDVDLQNGDVVLMMNGSRIESGSEFQDLYTELESGEIVKLGVSRNGRLMLVSFEKADESELPERRMMIVSDGGEMSGDSSGNRTMVRIGPEDGTIALITEAGVVLRESDNGLVADRTFPTVGEYYSGENIEAGDRLVSFAGEEITTAEKLREIYDSVENGDEIEVVFRRGDDMLKATLKKTNTNMQIRRESH